MSDSECDSKSHKEQRGARHSLQFLNFKDKEKYIKKSHRKSFTAGDEMSGGLLIDMD